ncbi:MAG TPA: hypothetical protein VFR71_01150 [Methyloceanibacter sp.]|nr:hypothetical protein [Methyloceanibacter sp.]
MLRKSLVVALGFLGLFLAGTIAGTQSASAHYACGPWNNWCGPKFGAYPGYHFGWYGHSYKKWGHTYSHKHWSKGKGKHHAHNGKHGKKYR